MVEIEEMPREEEEEEEETEEERNAHAKASNLKANGNEKFASMSFEEALRLYDDGVAELSSKMSSKEGEREPRSCSASSSCSSSSSSSDEDDDDDASEKDEEDDGSRRRVTKRSAKGDGETSKRPEDEKQPPTKTEMLLATLHANAGACLMKLERFEECVRRCSKAIALHPSYGKALARRAQAYEKLEDIERAFEDYEKAVAIEEKENRESADARRRMRKSAYREKVNALKPKVEAKREETKKEMFKQLRSLGDMVLGNFGLSCDNFKAEKDEKTGGFSLKFVQEKGDKTKTRVINENTNASATAAAAK
jgi:tetratricopeptide (TPR) repeat protein